ncbi:MAG: hypothetical protein ACRCXM_17260 [Beijerinckiaceae bacterium]
MSRNVRYALAAGALLFMDSPALACKCAPMPRQTVVDSVDLVFEGRVERVWTQGRKRLASVRVLAVEKGKVPSRMVIETAMDGASCGVAFKRGDVGDFPVVKDRLRRRVGLCDWLALQSP